MKISRGLALASLMTLAASPVFAGFSLDDVTKAASSMQGVMLPQRLRQRQKRPDC